MLVGRQCLCRHAWPEIGAANAEIDHVGDAFAGVATPAAAVDTLAKICHACEAGLDVGGGLCASTQGGVADGALLGVVDGLTGAHAFQPLAPVAGGGEIAQEGECFRRQPLFGEIKQPVAVAQGEGGKTLRVAGKQFSQVNRGHGRGMGLERLPGGEMGAFAHPAVVITQRPVRQCVAPGRSFRGGNHQSGRRTGRVSPG